MSFNYKARETKILLGKRGPSSDDNSCAFGVVFGETVVEVDTNNITLCYHEKPSDNVVHRIVDLSVIQMRELSFDSDCAYRNIPYTVAVELERTLRALIDLSINIDTYNEKIKSLALHSA